MKKKNIIICIVGTVILAGASAVAAYTLDGVRTVPPETPVEADVVMRETIDDSGNKRYITLTKEEVEAEAKWEKTKDILARVTAENKHFGEEYAASLKEVDGFGDDMIRDCCDMNEAQIKEYVERKAQCGLRIGSPAGTSYARIRDEILGKVPADAPRLTVEALEKLITESHSAVEFYNNIRSRYAVDFTYQFSGRDGGVDQYWLDDEGTEWIELVVVPNNENDLVVEWIALKNYDDYLGSGKTLYSDTDLKALYGEE